MIFIVILLSCMNIYLFTYLFLMKKEIRKIKIQLDNYNLLKTRKKLDISLMDKDIESLCESINKNIDVSSEFQLKEIESKNELKEIIANISHDLRTPLTSIIGYIQILRNPKISDTKKYEYLDITERRGKDLQRLLNDFFLLSIIESPNHDLKLEAVDIKEVFYDVLTSFYDEFTNNLIEPKINILNEDISILGETSSVKRVIENLMINLIKHSTGKVEINLLRVNDEIILKIINSAENLNKVEAKLIFNKFYKVDKSRNKEKGNTGLGLLIVKELMEKMHGSVNSDFNEGLLYIICKWNIIKC